MSDKLLLIDGHSILNRAFYGIPELTNSEGLHTNAVYGFLNIIFKIIEEEQPTHIAVAFDVKHPTFRHQRFPEYKGTRKPMPKELHEQVPLMKEVLHAMNIVTIELPGYEADDILGTLAKTYDAKGFEVRIISGDRDLLQLATDKIQIRIPKTKKNGTEIENYYAKDVEAALGVTPLEFIDVKALMGDTADNIPGVPGVGVKTATDLIATYHSVENLYEHIEEITKKKLKETLAINKDLALLSKELATINIESPVEFSIEEATLKDLFNDKSFEYMKRLEFKSLLKKFENVSVTNTKPIVYKRLDNYDDVNKILNKAFQAKKIALHMLGSENHTPLLLGIALSEEEIYVIPVKWFVTEQFLTEQFARLISNDASMTCVIGLKNQLKFMEKDIASLCNVFDAELAAYLMNPLKDAYHYDDLARDYLGETMLSQSELLKKFSIEKAFEQECEELYVLLANQVSVAFRVEQILTHALKESGQWSLYQDIELPLVFTLNRMENIGVRVEREALKKYSAILGEQIVELEQRIYSQVGEEFNINSPKQLGQLLFEKMQLPGGKKTKTGYSTSADILDKLAPDYPVVRDILEYRQYTKLKSTYAEGLQNYIANDGRIHGKFNQTITATGRISSTDPNLQNIPIRMELGKMFRKVFVPKEGCVFVDADYSQIELRILAHMSGDENLIEAYNSAQDIHRITASKVFHTPFEEVTPEQRRDAKAVNFGIVYGISSFGLGNDLGITKKQAQEYINQYFESYPNIKTFLDQSVAFAKEHGYIDTMFGRRRPVPEIQSSNFMQRSFGERIAMNSPIQGTAADIMKIAMLRVDKRLRTEGFASRIVLQVHDELLIEVPVDELDAVKELVVNEMKHAADLKVELDVGIMHGNNWLEAH